MATLGNALASLTNGAKQPAPSGLSKGQKVPLSTLGLAWLTLAMHTLCMSYDSWDQANWGTNPIVLLAPVDSEGIHCLRAWTPTPAIKTRGLAILPVCKSIHRVWTPESINFCKHYWIQHPVVTIYNTAE